MRIVPDTNILVRAAGDEQGLAGRLLQEIISGPHVLLLMTPLVAYAAFKLLIHEEDDYLGRRFGPAYLEYRKTVNELIPLPKL